jgi:hypothetical protein
MTQEEIYQKEWEAEVYYTAFTFLYYDMQENTPIHDIDMYFEHAQMAVEAQWHDDPLPEDLKKKMWDRINIAIQISSLQNDES